MSWYTLTFPFENYAQPQLTFNWSIWSFLPTPLCKLLHALPTHSPLNVKLVLLDSFPPELCPTPAYSSSTSSRPTSYMSFPDYSGSELLGFFKKYFYLLIFRERGREEEREGEKCQCVVASRAPPTGDLACNPSMRPDWESNQQPFGSQAGTQWGSTEPHQPGLLCDLFDTTKFQKII